MHRRPSSTDNESAPKRAIKIQDDATAEVWNRYVGPHRDATIYHSFNWRRVIQNTFGKETHYLSAHRPDGTICGVLPLVRIRSFFFGDNLVSLPYCNYGGPVVDDDDALHALRKGANERAAELNCDSLHLRDHIARPTDESWHSRSDKIRMLLELPTTVGALDRAIGSKRRSQINRCRREDPTVDIGGEELLKGFYRVFCENMRDLGTPVYPQCFFENVLIEFGQSCRLVVVRLGGEPVAGALLISHRDVLEIPWASSLRNQAKNAVNMLLYWESLSYAIEHGFRVFDFGRCTRGEGTYRFKKQWGSVAHELHWTSRTLRSTSGENSTGGGGKAEILRKLWTRLPLPIANRLGPVITSNLPW